MKNIVNNQFNIIIGTKFAPFIAIKIIKEFVFSHDYDEPYQYQPGSFIYSLPSKNPESFQKNYFIDSSNDYCSCLKSQYRGWPCRHLFKIWRATGGDILSKTLNSTHKHWSLNHHINIGIDETNTSVGVISSSEIITISPNKPLPEEVKNLHINYSSKKSTKKKRKAWSNLNPEQEFGLSLQRSHLNDNILFPFITLSAYSCRYDATLSLLYFLYKENAQSLQSNNSSKSMTQIFEKIDAEDFSGAQQAFIKYGLENGHRSNNQVFGSAADLLQKCLNNFSSFQITYEREKKCPNNCKYIYKSTFNDSIVNHSVEDSRNADKSILKNFLIRYCIHYSQTETCGCNSFRKPTRSNSNKSEFIATFSTKITNLPQYLVLALDDLYEADDSRASRRTNSLLKPQVAENFEIEQDLHFESERITVNAKLQAVIYFVNDNHYTIAYRNPRFKDRLFVGWSYYDSSPISDFNAQAAVKRFPNFHLDLNSLIGENKIPVILVYCMNKKEK